jgi:hypothetical protein
MEQWDDEVFGDVRKYEDQVRRIHAEKVQTLRTAIALADGIIALENQPGYVHLRKALEDMLAHRTERLMLAKSDRDTAVAQGACLELRSILSLVRSTKENRERLAKELEIEETSYRELESTFKPVPGEQR